MAFALLPALSLPEASVALPVHSRDAGPEETFNGGGKMMKTVKPGVLLVALLAAVLASGCIFGNDDKESSGIKQYESFGSWPQYGGKWKSITGAAGSKFARWVYLDITIAEDGRFSGRYSSYQYDYTYNMSTHMGTVPVDVYNPSSSFRDISGALNFGTNTGVATFGGIGETSFTINRISSDEIAFIFPSGFQYTVANVDRSGGTSDTGKAAK